MTTINGVTFNMKSLVPVATHRNIPSEQPGSDENFISDMGYSGLVLRLVGYEKTLAKYDEVIHEFMKPGEHTLVFRTGWQYKVYSAILRPVFVDGVVDNFFPYELTLLTSTPYRESTSETTRSKTISSDGQEWSADDSTNDIETDGSVDAIPDIKVTGVGGTESGIFQVINDSNYNVNNSGDTIVITQATVNDSYVVNVSSFRGQTINCRKAGLEIIDSIDVNVDVATTAGNVTCSVYDSVSGTLLGSKVLYISSSGWKNFAFATPIVVVQDENTCADATDTKKIYFKLTATGSTVIWFGVDTTGGYVNGSMYYNDTIDSGKDLSFYINGHSSKEIRQTFTVPESRSLSKITLQLCKYGYSGSNPVTVIVKQGATTLGTGTTVLDGTTFTDVDFYLEEESSGSLDLSSSTTYTIHITPPSDNDQTTGILIKTNTTSVYTNGSVTVVDNNDATYAQTHDIYFKLFFISANTDVQVYNIADSTVKCDVADSILRGAIHRVNIDGTGSVEYDDDFTTDKYLISNEGLSGITHDTGDDELDIADDGYIYYKIDTKYPVTGIPTLTSRINITAGTPTIQISINGTTWYDISTAIVDDVETVYDLDSTSLHIKESGATEFYFRFDCVKGAAATCSIKNFELHSEMITIDAEHPKISSSGISTFKCDQGDDSGVACVVALIYNDRSWPV